jgi:hypothetical protein
MANNSNGNYIYTGIDRVNNSRGYEIDNVTSCCWDCNNKKRTMTKEDFFSWVKSVYEYSILTLIQNQISDYQI